MDYLVHFENGSSGYLAHYGVLGMKWGVRKAESVSRIRRAHTASVTDVKLGSLSQKVKDSGRKRVNGLLEDYNDESERVSDRFQKELDTLNRYYETENEIGSFNSDLQGPKSPSNLALEQISNTMGLLQAKESAISSNLESEIPRIQGEHTIDDDMKAANPLRGAPGYDDNCACCSAATILRQKGFDVVADVRGDDGTMNMMLPTWFDGAQIKSPVNDGGGSERSSLRSEYLDSIGGESKVSDWGKADRGVVETWMVHDEPEGSSGFLNGQYDSKYGSGGHSITYKIENGRVVCRDGQSGEKYDSFYDATKHFDLEQVTYMRTDDKEPNWASLASQKVVRYRNDYYD